MFERNPFMQVVPAPKKKTKKENDDKDKSTEVKPQTWCQKATSMMADLLKWAADARTASLKLAERSTLLNFRGNSCNMPSTWRSSTLKLPRLFLRVLRRKNSRVWWRKPML